MGIGLGLFAILADGVFAVLKFLDGEYLWSFNYASWLILWCISLAILIGGTIFVKKLNNRPWFAAALLLLMVTQMVVMTILLKRGADQDRASTYQPLVQATQPVKGAL